MFDPVVLRVAVRAAALIYEDWAVVASALAGVGMDIMNIWMHADAEAMLIAPKDGTWAMLVFRGTQASEGHMTDIWTNVRVPRTTWSGAGKVHWGYDVAARKLWDRFRIELADLEIPYYVTGHSLGGAVATITTGYIELSSDIPEPAGLITFGSPRAGNREFAESIRTAHARFVHGWDIAPTWPPGGLFWHVGEKIKLETESVLPCPIGDHSIERYVRQIDKWLHNVSG